MDHLKIMHLGGESDPISLDLDSSSTVRDLKSKVQQTIGQEVGDIRLDDVEGRLEEDKTLVSYGVTPYANVYFSLRFQDKFRISVSRAGYLEKRVWITVEGMLDNKTVTLCKLKQCIEEEHQNQRRITLPVAEQMLHLNGDRLDDKDDDVVVHPRVLTPYGEIVVVLSTAGEHGRSCCS